MVKAELKLILVFVSTAFNVGPNLGDRTNYIKRRTSIVHRWIFEIYKIYMNVRVVGIRDEERLT